MPEFKTLKVPFNGDPYQNVDSLVLNEFAVEQIDMYTDEGGAVNKRPGLLKHADLLSLDATDGLYWWDEQDIVIAVAGGRIFRINDALGNFTDITGDGLLIGRRPTFASNGEQLIMANGDRMVRYTGSGTTTYIADADAPTKVTHVIFFDQYILANNVGTGQFHFSDVADPGSWSALSFATAESRPDVINAIYEAWREVTIFGKRSMEAWWNDGTTPFQRIEGGYSEIGVVAPHSVQIVNGQWIMLADDRKLKVIDGRTPKTLSTPFDKTIQNFNTVSDAISDIYRVEGRDFYVLSFPTEDITLTYDFNQNIWSRWGYWNTTKANHERFLGNAYCFAKTWNQHLVGDKNDGIVYLMDADYKDDNNDKIRSVRRTGHIDHGTSKRKMSHRLRFKFRRGIGDGPGSNAEATLRWRDDGENAFGPEEVIDLGQEGDNSWFVELVQLGTYRSRQYELAMSDNSGFVLVDVEEDVTILDI